MKKRGRYPREFKIEAVRMLNEGRKRPADIAMELGIKRTLLYRWKDQLESRKEKAFPGSGKPKKEDLSDLTRLRQELREVKEERDILKKAVAYFTKDPK
jgi:transposase-like protein